MDKPEQIEEFEVELVEPYNPTDPIVVYDPQIEPSNIAQKSTPSNSSDAGVLDVNTPIDQTRVTAVIYPLVSINQHVISGMHQFDTFEMSFEEFMPKLHLIVFDEKNEIKSTNTSGMNNKITVIITAPTDGTAKKITMDFYAAESKVLDDGRIEYDAEFDLPELRKIQNKQIGTDKMTTYEMFEELAKSMKLGFAATEDCKNVTDKRWRQIYGTTYPKFINDQMTFAGTDKDSVFDVWIDQYMYIVLVNLPWIVKQDVQAGQLTTKVYRGFQSIAKQDTAPDPEIAEVPRIISNEIYQDKITNNKFDSYKPISNNEDIIENGTSNTYYYLHSVGDENLIEKKNICISERTIDGVENFDKYKFEKLEFLGFEMDDDNPILFQTKIVKAVKASMFSSLIEVELENPNYLLQRGMLLNAIFMEYDQTTKATLQENINNPNATEKTDEPIKENNPTQEDNDMKLGLAYNKLEGTNNSALTGLYYIKGVRFRYLHEDQGITQILTLMPKQKKNNILNDNTAVNVPSLENDDE